MSSLNEMLGLLGGALLAPAVGAGSWLRSARALHPEGVCCRARVEVMTEGPPFGAVAESVAGEALVRLSTALWRGGREWPDALGCAVRFRDGELTDPRQREGDQDLLFATIPRPWLTLLSPLWTNPHDFLDNTYYAVSPFEIPGGTLARWRLVPRPTGVEGPDRIERLRRAMERGSAALRMEGRLERESVWRTVLELRLVQMLEMDQEALRFSPFLAGRGIRPRGFVHALRHATYGLSQRMRP